MLSTNRYRQGIILALLTAVCLGSITTQAKLFYAEGGNAMTLMLVRFLSSSIIFAILLRLGNQSFRVDARHRIDVILVGAVWSTAMIFYLLSVETISVSVAVLVLYSYPVLVLIYAIVKRQLKPTFRLISLFLLAFFGLYLALSAKNMQLNAAGLGFAILAGLGAAFTFIKGARVAPLLNPLLMTFWVNLIGLIIILPLVISQFSPATSSNGMMALTIASLFYIIAILCQFQALARLSASTAALILNLEPVVSILLSVLILNEYLATSQWVGVVLVVSVLFITVRSTDNQQEHN